jgi:hypothetical protein
MADYPADVPFDWQEATSEFPIFGDSSHRNSDPLFRIPHVCSTMN